MADYNVGSIDATLGFDYESIGAERWESKLREAELKAKKPVRANLGFDFDERGFQTFEKRVISAHGASSKLAGGLKGLFKQAGLISGVGIATEAISALGGAAVAATSSLGPLVGVMGALPGAASAAGQGLGVFKLATSNIFDAVGGLNERLDKQAKAYRELDPAAKKVAQRFDEMKKPIRELQKESQRGLFPSMERGIEKLNKLMPIFRPLVRGTAEELGRLTESASGGLVMWGPDIERQGRRNIRWLGDMGSTVGSLANAIRHVTIEAGPLTNWLIKGAKSLADWAEASTKAGRESGALRRFFEETRWATTQWGSAIRDLGAGLINIGKISYRVLGRDMLHDLREVSSTFREWTESARGRNDIKQYFEDARPGIYALFRLIDGFSRAFFRLGRGDQVAPLLDTINRKLVPAVEDLIKSTTETFGPVFIDFLEQAILLFTHLAGDSGPLHEFTRMMARILGLLNDLLDRFPVLNDVIVGLAAAGGIYKALQIGAAITGVSRLIGMLKTARGVAAGTAAAGAAGGAATGAAAGAGGGLLTRIPGPAKIVAAAIAGTVGLHEVAQDRQRDQGDERLQRILSTMREIGKTSKTVTEAQERLRAFRRQWNDVANLPGKPREWKEYYGGVVEAADEAIRKLAQGELDKNVRDTNRNITKSWHNLRDNTDATLKDIREQVRASGTMIKTRLGKDTEDGKDALARNFRQAARAVRQQMRNGEVSTKEGLALIEQYMARALESYGISKGAALSIARHGDIKGSKGPAAAHGDDLRGGQRGGRFASGGWLGGRGMVSGDIVPIGGGAVAALGEYDANGPGNRRAIINRHQAPFVEVMLAAGGYPSLDMLPPGNQLPIIERAMGGPHMLDMLFSMVNRPHMYARGGIVPVPGFPGEMANSSILDEIAMVHRRFPSLVLTDAYGQGHQSPGHTRTGTAADFSGPDRAMNAAVAMLTRMGYLVGYDGRFGSQDWPGHGPSTRTSNFHFHVEFASAAAKIRDMIDRIKAPAVRGGGAVGRAVQGGLRMVAGGATHVLEKAVQSSLAVPTAGGRSAGAANSPALIRRWIAAGLRLAGVPATRANINTLFGRVMQESGGDPNAVNNWDVNARRGDPSIGLLQTIGATFRAYAVRGHNNIRNPVDNVAAAVRYMLARYGHLVGRGPGGYNRGGRFQSGGRAQYQFEQSQARGQSLVGEAIAKARGIGTRLKFRSRANSSITHYNNIMADVEDLGREYELQDRKYNQTDEQLLNDDGSINQAAINQRAGELDKLIHIRERIARKLRKAQEFAQRVVRNLTKLIRNLRRSLKHARRKDRSGVRAKIAKAQRQLDEFAGIAHDMGYDIRAADLDVEDLQLEKAEVTGTTPDTSLSKDTSVTDEAQAIADSANRRADALAAENASLSAAVRAFGSPGDIAQGGFANAYIAATQGSVPGAPIAGGMTFVQQNYMLTPDDPAVLRGVASAAVGGFSQQPFRASTRESYNI